VIKEGQEVVLIAKTTAEMVIAATQKIVDLHSFDIPCVVSLPIDGGNQEFLRWIGDKVN
jgi:periplasmic divalent cation tolerance protein